jgi:arylsulfatase
MRTRSSEGHVFARISRLALLAGAAILICGPLAAPPAKAATGQKPNIVVIWGDDIGRSNISAYTDGLMGYQTPNIDRLAKEGMKFTDYYAENSCTAGRAAFITGQSVFRTGNSKVGLPGAKQGLSAKDATIAELLKPQGYATAQYGKNHLGDRNEYLPTVHGFDEFYGVLYHLNAMQDIFSYDYPPPPFLEQQGPRGVIDSIASDKDDKTVDPRFGKVGKQVILSDKMWKKEDIAYFDDKVSVRAQDFMERQTKADKPFFVWVNFTHMHLWTYTKKESLHQSGPGGSPYHDSMIDHDKNVGEVLDKIDALGIADNTIVIYGTDNGPHMNTWPDGAMTPFRGEKTMNFEGAFRTFVRWPGKIKAGSISNEIMSNLDWAPTLVAAAGEPDVKKKLLTGYNANDKKFKIHLDGYDFLPYLTGKEAKGPREEFFYFSDDGDMMALRFRSWKIEFAIQPTPGTFKLWQTEFEHPRVPYVYNLRTDPYERATITSNSYNNWLINHTWALVPVQGIVGKFLSTFKAYPPRAKAASFSINQALEKLQSSHGG